MHNGYKYNQLIYELRISNRLRSSAEIAAAYNGTQQLPIDETTTCKMDFDGNLRVAAYNTTSTGDILGTGFLPYWNYNTASLGL
ncbi:MAG: hypothetical protein PHT62_07100 [Desulfotomaculaceae bacterium]|nr:hypothetical protein [Desulfotomaculaceae bacterium]